MPQANDSELTKAYTTPTGIDVENNEPNADGPAGNFDLRLEAVAGSVLGDSGATYKLTVDCIDDTLAERNANMSEPVPLAQAFNNAVGSDWLAAGNNFKKEQTINFNVDAQAKGHVLHYVVTLVGDNGDVVSFIESNKFILI